MVLKTGYNEEKGFVEVIFLEYVLSIIYSFVDYCIVSRCKEFVGRYRPQVYGNHEYCSNSMWRVFFDDYTKKEFGIRDGVSDKYIILGAEECKTMTTDYLIANVIPLIAFDFAQWYEVLKFIIIFLVIGCLCITHNIFNVNILMELMKYKQYDCRLVNEDNIEISRRVISKNALTMKKGNWISVRQINNEYYLE